MSLPVRGQDRLAGVFLVDLFVGILVSGEWFEAYKGLDINVMDHRQSLLVFLSRQTTHFIIR